MNTTANNSPERQPPGVMVYYNFYDALKDLPEETVGKLLLALMRYALLGEEPDFPPMLMVAWTFIKNYADADCRRYTETLQRRRDAAEKRWNRQRTGKTETEAKTAQPTKAPDTPQANVHSAPPPPAPAADDDEPPASPEWVRENILSGKNGAFVAGMARKLYPDL